MSVIVNSVDITKYINQGGISESTKREYADESAAAGTAESKGAHYIYNISAQMPDDIKSTMSACMEKGTVDCTVGGDSCRAEMTNFTAAVLVEIGGMTLWNVSFTLTDIALSDESGEQQ